MMVISGGFGSPLVSGGEEDDVISLRRDLEGRHIFAFTISAIIGAGFYIRTGTVEAIGGPGAVIVAYSLLGVLALAISQDLATMLHCWPIPGASFTFIRDFFDPDFAWISGWLYLLTHGCCLAALLGTIGDLVDSLNPSGGMSILVKTIAILFPTLVNLADIRYLKEVQFGAAIFKLLLALIMIVGMLWINPTVASASIHDSHLVKKERIFFDKGPGGYFGTISIAVFNLCFSFIGIEVAAALAIETNVTQSKHTDRIPGYEPLPEEYDLRQAGTQGKDPFHLSAILVPLTVVVIYVSGAWAVTENITHYDNRLPSLDGGSNASHSPFISSGQDYSEKLGKTITISIILILESTAIASLYVVSRSLYGLALVFSGHADGTADNPNEGCRLKALFLVLSHRSDFHVPWVAVLVSAALPIVLPLFKYTWPDVIGPALHFTLEVGSTSCVLIWGVQSLATWRAYRCIRRNIELLEDYVKPDLMMQIRNTSWYYFRITVSFLAAIVCFAIVILGGTITYLHNPTRRQSGPMTVVFLLFAGSIIIRKTLRTVKDRHSAFRIADLRYSEDLKRMFRLLNGQTTANFVDLGAPQVGYLDVFGIINSKWVKQKVEGRRH